MWTCYGANSGPVQSYDISMFGNDAVLGCDFVGKVVELGEGVGKYAVGDLIASTVWGGKLLLHVQKKKKKKR